MEVSIFDLISKGKYKIIQNDSNPKIVVNTISMDKNIYATLSRGCLKNIPNLIATKKVSVPPNPKYYTMIMQLKTTLAKISLYYLISTSKKSRDIVCFVKK